ncbi:MAG TPA: cystathionine gamma-synthase [Myxococcota bacterium]|nr:cystathionine gamma-synthase [Myxococcota bacterium]HQK50359.1 cystathionine gamma-synthase [Myxococcota bacterium]
MRFETAAIHAGQEPEPRTGAVVVPIFQTSTYAQSSPGQHRGYEYTRTQNPTRDALQEALAALEAGRHGLAFASGLAATNTVMNLLKAGDHVVCSDDVYGGTFRIFDKVWRQCGIDFTFVDARDPARVEDAIRERTRLIWVETPSNPLLKLVDLRAIADIGRHRGVLTVCDNTFASPFFQKPLALGIDLVVHSTTKYIGGHSDVVGGAIVMVRDDLRDRLQFFQNAVGACTSPFDSWLTLRGLKTLAVRMERHFQNALAVARFLEGHPRVERVLYPWLPSHPQHDLAKAQMTGMSGMVSFELAGGLEASRRFLERVRVFTLAESLGGVESLIEHPAIMTHASIPPEMRAQSGIRDGLCRASVGIEHVDDLLEDLDQALQAI